MTTSARKTSTCAFILGMMFTFGAATGCASDYDGNGNSVPEGGDEIGATNSKEGGELVRPAGEVVQKFLHVHTYRVARTHSGYTGTLVAADGSEKGTFTFEDGTLTLATDAGERVQHQSRMTKRSDGSASVWKEFDDGQTVLRITAELDSNGGLSSIAYAAGPKERANLDTMVVSLGATPQDTELSRLQDWLAAHISGGEAIKSLYLLEQDSSWKDALAALSSKTTVAQERTDGLGTAQQALDMNYCLAVVGATGVVYGVCATCIGSLTALPVTASWSAILAIPSCFGCSVLGAVDLYGLWLCLTGSPPAPSPSPTPPPSTARTGTVKVGSVGLNVRSCPKTTCSIVGKVYNGQKVTISCQAYGTQVTGGPYGTSKIWDFIGTGYVSDAYVSTGGAGLFAPLCK
jgi:hypothetical protein